MNAHNEAVETEEEIVEGGEVIDDKADSDVETAIEAESEVSN